MNMWNYNPIKIIQQLCHLNQERILSEKTRNDWEWSTKADIINASHMAHMIYMGYICAEAHSQS